MDQDGTWHGGRPQPRRPCGVRCRVIDRREQVDVRTSVPKIFDVWQSLLNVLN